MRGTLPSIPLTVAMVVVSSAAGANAEAAPIDLSDFFLDAAAEVALARSAAPEVISGDATVLVLGSAGYEVAETGTNGFTCMVLRSWSGPAGTMDPGVKAPICLNPPASDTVLRRHVFVAARVAAGVERGEAEREIDGLLARGEMRRPGPGALGYMMSAGQWLNERVERFLPHLMFFQPGVGGADVANAGLTSGLPFVIGGATGDWGDITVTLPESSFVEPEGEGR
ncbi:MAG: hypothetical protein GKS06_00815 [Acidobacteria bacterium]|nr:hypothetical protein [Acidobacteriota bacterium]